jgi:DNA-binding MarR family transcriptional regulator
MAVRAASLEAYKRLERTGNLQRREADVLLAAFQHFGAGAFTRKELAHAMGWEINRVVGRVFTLVERGTIAELAGRRDGSGLLHIALHQADLFPVDQPAAPEQ